MYEKRIAKMVNDLFYDIVESPEVREQKEELCNHLSERVSDHMAAGHSFEDALLMAKAGLGDPNELVEGFERKKIVEWDSLDDGYGLNLHFRVSSLFTKLTSLTPFIYVILGLTQNSWMPWLGVDFNWWGWGLFIFPVLGILGNGFSWNTLTALSPFIYIILGLSQNTWQPALGVDFNWWLWGWMIIPICGILFTPHGGRRRRKKRRKHMRVRVNNGKDIIIEGNTVGEFVDDAITSALEKVTEKMDDALEREEQVIFDDTNRN